MRMNEKSMELNEQNPWPGLAPYDELGRSYFKGREEDTEELLRMIRLGPLTTLYGKSGLGKSSLLLAGLFPKLRKNLYLPVYIRLDCSASAGKSSMQQVFDRLLAELSSQKVDFPQPMVNESIWSYLHRRELEFWSSDNRLLTPVLVFDQFEEVFSHAGLDTGRFRRTCHELADLIENRIPAELGADENGRQAAAELDLLSQRYRILLSFREDFLPEINNWEREVPSLLKQWRQLKPMSREQAIDAVADAGASVLADGAAEAIVDFVGKLDEIENEGVYSVEPVLLSLCCYQLNIRRQQQKISLIDDKLLSHVGQNILQEFYTDSLARMPHSVRMFIETHLILGDRYRASYPVKLAIENKFINEQQLGDLTGKHRLLRIDQQMGSDRIELIHDRIVSVVRQARDQRLARAEKRQILILAGVVTLTVSGIMGWLAYWQSKVAETNQQWAAILEEKADANAIMMAQTALVDAKRSLQGKIAVSDQHIGVVYIQIKEQKQINQSNAIREMLAAQGYEVPPVEVLSTGPARTEIRFFDSKTAGNAEKLVGLLKKAGVADLTTKLISDYQHVKRRHRVFEIWFSMNAFTNLP